MQPDLAARYREERLPRYTSYPTAPHFSTAVTRETYAGWLAALPGDVSGSLYLHIPFCRSMCWYCGCHTTVARHDAPVAAYVTALRREIDLVADRLGGPLPVRRLHFGGGTPTILPPEALLGLVAAVRARFPVAEDAEIAIEVDPRTLTGAMIAALGAAGVTRASLGIQSLDPAVQRAVNRVQGFDEAARAAEGLRAAGVSGINLDLIYGLPHETVASSLDTVRRCLTLRPERFAVFGYAHLPGFKKHQRKIDEAALADAEGRLAQAEAVAGLLAEAGYVPIGIDHYALPEDPLAVAARRGRLRRNFQGYTNDPCDVLIGLGASAIGRLPRGYLQNEVALPRYAARVAEGALATVRGHALTPDDRLRADVIERIMCDFRADLGALCERHGADPAALLAASPQLPDLVADGVARVDGSVVSVAEAPHILARSVAAAFDAYLGAPGRAYSRAV